MTAFTTLLAFATRPCVADDPVLLATGDIASCDSSGDEATAALVASLEGEIVVLGDVAYQRGSASDFQNCYEPAWGKLKTRTHPTPGNHEYKDPNAGAYFAYFGAAAGAPGAGWYSFDLGAWHIVALNSNCAEVGGCARGSPQAKWLEEDLEAHPARCTLAYWHHPLFNSAYHHDDARVADLWAILEEHDAEVVLTAHAHVYERFAPQDVAGNADPRGIRQFTVGTGGRSHHHFLGRVRPNSEARDSTSYGVLALTLHPDSYEWRFVPVAGASYTDGGRADCIGDLPRGN